jgi:hypothetical protein
VAVRVQATEPSDTLVLEFELFNTRDKVALRLLALDASATHSFRAETRIARLSRPHVTDRPLPERLASAFFLPLAIPLATVILVASSYTQYRANGFTTPGKTLESLMYIAFATLFFGAMLGYILAIIAARAVIVTR